MMSYVLSRKVVKVRASVENFIAGFSTDMAHKQAYCMEFIHKIFDIGLQQTPAKQSTTRHLPLQPRIKNTSLEPPIRMNDNLSIPILPLIKLLISSFRIRKTNFMRDHKAGLGLARDNHVPQVPVIRLDVALPSAEGEALFELARFWSRPEVMRG